jgi:hypothetical protein
MHGCLVSLAFRRSNGNKHTVGQLRQFSISRVLKSLSGKILASQSTSVKGHKGISPTNLHNVLKY